jgi:cyclophilin family peptidyl-prolyl cis-trans isomerase
VERLEERRLLSVTINPVPDKTMPIGKSLILPITATDTDGNPLTYSFTSDNSQVTVQQHTGNTYLKLSVQNFGDLTFQLFNDLTPKTVGQITALVNRGFYNGLTFHRVVPNFVIQGGDPNGDGTGGPGFTFDNEFNLSAIFSGDGQLAMANSGSNTDPANPVTGTNGSQFFITIGAQRALDFNHTIFGQLVRGSDPLHPTDSPVQQGLDLVKEIAAVPASNNRPNTPVVITTATIIQDTSDTVITLNSTSNFQGFAKITVSVDNGHGGTDNQVITVQGTTDIDPTTGQPLNDPAILGTVANQTTNKNTPVTFNLTGQDLENDPLTFAVDTLDSPAHATVAVNGSQITITPDQDFTGVIHLLAKVEDQGATRRGTTSDPFDKLKFTLTVSGTGGPVQPTPGTTTAYVTELYRTLLGREPDGAGMSQFQGMLDRNQATRAQVAITIETSLEGRTKQVQDFYQKYLGRRADPIGLDLSVRWLGAGGSMFTLRDTIVGSPEYFGGHGKSTNSDFVTALYRDALMRAVDPVGLGGDVPALNAGMKRSQLTDQVFRSPEGLQVILQGYYSLLLHRTIDNSGLTFHRQELQNGGSDYMVVAGIAASDEFFNQTPQ